MIKKSIVFATILFLGYSIYIATIGSKSKETLYVQQEYFAKSQDLLYNSDFTGKNVFVGSSLTKAAIVEKDTIGLEEIGLPTRSSFDGLNLINFKNQKPKCIYIETNYIQRDEKKKFSLFLFSPEQYYPKKYFASLREDSQPLTLFGSYISKVLNPYFKLFIPNKRLPKPKASKNVNKNVVDDGFNKIFANTKKDYNSIPDSFLLHQMLNKLDSFVIDYTKKGITIVFVELPVNEALLNSPRSTVIRNAFYHKFPKNKYHYIDVPDSLHFKTIDGIHLTSTEAKTYTAYFKSKMLK